MSSQEKYEELFPQNPEGQEAKSESEEIDCRSEVLLGDFSHEEMLFRSLNFGRGEQSGQNNMEIEDSFQMDKVKELVNTLIEEKEKMK